MAGSPAPQASTSGPASAPSYALSGSPSPLAGTSALLPLDYATSTAVSPTSSPPSTYRARYFDDSNADNKPEDFSAGHDASAEDVTGLSLKDATTSTRRSSTFGIIFRFIVSSYLLIALIYTFWHVAVRPTVFLLSYDVSNAPSNRNSVPSDPVESAAWRAAKIPNDMGQKFWPSGVITAPVTMVKVENPRGTALPSSEHTPLRHVSWHEYGRIHGVEWDKEVLEWHPTSDDLAQQGGMSMTEDFFLSKAFGESLQPSKVIPYYYRAAAKPVERDITITTLVTSNRFKVLAQLADKYQGPISVTIHVPNDGSSRTELLDSLHALYTTSSSMSSFVDVHLVIDNFDRQFNMWRNVAKFFARTAYVMMLDVDFAICTDFRTRILSSQVVLDKLDSGTAAFVVPAFEYSKQVDGLDRSTFPDNKADLVKLVEKGKIGIFHKGWAPGHGSTNYTRYYEAKPSEVYRVQTYNHAYEPYVIYKKEGTPYCDERFIGYGANKAACLFELYLSGISFYVLPDDFLIHQSHEYAEAARKNERRYNRKLYTDFREEICFRYLSKFMHAGVLETPVTKNLVGECKKIKGFATAARKYIAAST